MTTNLDARPRPTSTGFSSPWAVHIGVTSVLLALLGLVFSKDIAAAVTVWWVYPAYSHGFLIVPVSAWLIWEKRREIALTSPAIAPAFLALALLPALAWVVGEIAAITELRQFAVVGFVQVILVTILGPGVYRRIWFPALFLFFLVPTGQFLIPPLQHFTTRFADIALNLIGIPHFTEGTVIQMPNGSFEVAEACAGLRFLTAAIALGVVFSYLTFQRWFKWAFFLVACVIVPIIGNGFRVLGILLLAYATNNKVATGADHIIYGWGFSVAILLVLLFIGSRFADPSPQGTIDPTPSGKSSAVVTSFVALILGMMIMAGPAAAAWIEGSPTQANVRLNAQDLSSQGWLPIPASGQWHPAYAAPDAELHVQLIPRSSKSSDPVDLAVEYISRVREGHKLLASENRPWDSAWRLVGEKQQQAKMGNGTVEFSEWLIAPGENSRLVWSTYWVDDQFVSSEIHGRILQLEAAISSRQGAALVAASTPITTTVEQARSRLRRALGALTNLPEVLERASNSSRPPRRTTART